MMETAKHFATLAKEPTLSALPEHYWYPAETKAYH